MKIVLIFDDLGTRPNATADERGVLETVDAVETALARIGHHPMRAPVGGRPAQWLGAIADAHPDLVFNLCEGVEGSSAREPHVAALVELLGLPLTGNTAETLALARRKDRVNALLAGQGLTVPAWRVVREGEPVLGWNLFPAIVKPAGEDGSVGITQRSVARDAAELANAIAEAGSTSKLIIQQFIGGREFNAGFVADHVLPVSEIDFARMPPDAWRIVCYRAKWETGSAEDLGSAPVCPAHLSAEEAARILSAAHQAWSAVEGAGYGRIDIRISDDGSPFVLDVNPNPDLAPSAGLARMAAARGWSYDELIGKIVEEAVSRAGAALQSSRPGEPALPALMVS